MKKILTAIAFVLLSCSMLNAQEGHLKIKGIPIEGNLSTFMSKLKATGLKAASFGGVECLEGKFAGTSDCYFLFGASQTSKTVFRVAVIMPEETSWRSLKGQYESVKDNYSSKYGNGRSYEWFDSPYYEGDGYEMQALKKDKCNYTTFFDAPGGSIKIEIQSWAPSAGIVLITYEDEKGMAIAKAENNAIVNDDI